MAELARQGELVRRVESEIANQVKLEIQKVQLIRVSSDGSVYDKSNGRMARETVRVYDDSDVYEGNGKVS